MPKLAMSDGARLNYRVDDFTPPWMKDDDKATILMHHGFARNMKWWTLMVPALSRYYRVLRVDARGCGASTVPSRVKTWKADRVIRDTNDLLDHLNIRKVHWVGEASGGCFGLVFYFAYPERIKTLTLINTPFRLQDQRRRTQSLGYIDAATAIEKVGLKEWTTRTLGDRLDLSIATQQVQDWFVEEHSKTPAHMAALYSRIVDSVDFSGRLAEIGVPTLIIRSNKGQSMPLEEYKSLIQPIPNLKLVALDDIGPCAELLRPDRCAEEIIEFLESR